MTQKHTQGPWEKVGEWLDAGEPLYAVPCGDIKAMYQDARELYEALKIVSNFNWKNNRVAMLKIVNAAIAKATVQS